MSPKSLKATFDTLNWDEKPITIEGSDVKLTRVRTELAFKGDVVGKGVVEYTFSYHPADPANKAQEEKEGHGTVAYTGLMHFKGTIDGMEPGEVVFLVNNGLYSDAARGNWVVDEKSATGGLKGIKGKGGYEARGRTDTPAWFEIEA